LDYLYEMNHSTGLLRFCLPLFFLWACNSDSKVEVTADQIVKQPEATISQTDIEALNFDDFVLDPKAQQLTADWLGFQEIASSIEYLKTGDLSFFKSDIEDLKTAIDKFKLNVTKPFFTDAIMSRIVVVETRFLKLQNDLTLDNISKEEQLNSIREVFIAWSNFIYVINKKFEFEATDTERPE